MPTSPPPRPFDVLIASVGGTPGLRQADEELAGVLTALGQRVRIASGSRGALLGLSPAPLAFTDLVQAYRTHRLVKAAVARDGAGSVIYPSTLSAVFEPRSRLRASGVRFDAQAQDNRRGARNAAQRLLERRVIRQAGLLLPYSLSPSPHRRRLPGGTPVVPLPRAVDPSASAAETRRAAALVYAGNPHKKGLDLAAAAITGFTPHIHLVVAGLDAAAGRAFLAARGIAEPAGTRWLGQVPEPAFRRLTAECELFVNASRYEDFGAAQLEAMADGCVLVSVPSGGPAECLELLRRIDARLVARACTAEALELPLRRATSMSESDKAAFRTRARELLAPYSSESLRAQVATRLIPELERMRGRP